MFGPGDIDFVCPKGEARAPQHQQQQRHCPDSHISPNAAPFWPRKQNGSEGAAVPGCQQAALFPPVINEPPRDQAIHR
jgi:hypothetical protein